MQGVSADLHVSRGASSSMICPWLVIEIVTGIMSIVVIITAILAITKWRKRI